MKDLMAQFREVAPEHKRELGPLINKVKTAVEEKVAAEKASFNKNSNATSSGIADASRPAGGFPHGTHHPFKWLEEKSLGFSQIWVLE